MTDINKRAIWLTTENIRLNRVKAEVRWGSLFDPVRDMMFETVVTNPPISAGKVLIINAIDEASHHISRGGTLQLVARTNKGARSISMIMKRIFGNVDELEKKSGYRVFSSQMIEKRGE
jgi:16S rRNA G1207 methylase RsmC